MEISRWKCWEFVDKQMEISSNSTIASHAAITFVVIILTIATTVGYQVTPDDDDRDDDDDYGDIMIMIT